MSESPNNGNEHAGATAAADKKNGHSTPNGGGMPVISRPSWLNGRTLGILIAAFVVVMAFGVRHVIAAGHFVSTDDAYLTADVTSIAPQVSGTVKEVLVKENQEVKKGDLLVVLDDATYRATVAQRQADLDAAIAQAKGAGVSVSLTGEQGNAATMQAQGAVDQAESGIAGAKADATRSVAGVQSAIATARSVRAGVGTASAGVNSAIVGKRRSAEAIRAAEAQLASAKSGVLAAQAGVDAAKAVYDRTERDAQRYARLASQGAVSAQTHDSAASAAAASGAQLESARQQLSSAQALVQQKQADLSASRQALEASDAAIAQARSQLSAAREQAAAADEAVNQARAQSASVQQGIRQAEAKREQALGQLTQAHTSNQQVNLSRSAQEQARAKVEQARAALDAARLQLSYTKIYAPADCRITRKSVEVGSLVQPGSPLMAAVLHTNIWVIANFKETQMSGLKAGCAADVSVDAVPGRVFHGRVDSLSPATGSTLTLLPADNATGNFTKVVQRMPVKITIDPGQPDSEVLSAGMSVVATVRKG